MMAIAKDRNFKGISIQNAYHRVSDVSLNKTEMLFSVGVHAIKDSECLEVLSFTCAYSLVGENPIKQAYEHLKTLPEFDGSEDV